MGVAPPLALQRVGLFGVHREAEGGVALSVVTKLCCVHSKPVKGTSVHRRCGGEGPRVCQAGPGRVRGNLCPLVQNLK